MNSQKHLFNLPPDTHYLNCAYKAPLMRSAEEACIQALVRERNPADISVPDFFDDKIEVRTLFAKLVNCKPEQVAFLPSTSYGFSSVLNNIVPKTGGNVVTLKDEFPSGYFSLSRWTAVHNNQLIAVGPDEGVAHVGENWNNKLVDAIDQNTSIVMLSAAHWMNGIKFDLKRIGEKCRAVGAKLLVDGTQSVGVAPIDLQELHVHALVCATYKWLMGPYSMALAYISDDFSNGVPLEESWMNRTNARAFSSLTDYDPNYQAHAGRYNVGESSNFILMPIIRESLTQINAWGVANMQDYCKELIQPLTKYLHGLGVTLEDETYFSNHLFALQLPSAIKIDLLQEKLKQRNIIVSVRGAYIRVSVNVFNEPADIQQLIDAIEEARAAS